MRALLIASTIALVSCAASNGSAIELKGDSFVIESGLAGLGGGRVFRKGTSLTKV